MRANLLLIAVILVLIPFFLAAKKAPDFVVTDQNNKVHKLYEDYLNKDKVVVIKFFFVGCPPCSAIAPYVQSAYVRWGAGNGRVQFFEISTMKGDNNALIKGYQNGKGLTFPGVGTDGGSQAAREPYTSGTFGPFYATPTFVVISPDGEVNYNVNVSIGDQSPLDTAIARGLRVSHSGGGGGCSKAFSVKTVTTIQPETYYLVDLLNGNPAHEVKTGIYNCEFALPSITDGFYVIPQMNQSDDPINGVTTADIVHIQRHILGLQQLNNLQRAVADVNGSSTITAADVSEIRKLILGVTSGFSKLNKTFTIVHNPKAKSGPITDRVLMDDLVSGAAINEFGIGKYGDVSGANLFQNENLEIRASLQVDFLVESNRLADGTYEHRFFAEKDYNLTSFQFEVSGKDGNLINCLPSYLLKPEQFKSNTKIGPGAIRFLWNSQTRSTLMPAFEPWFSIITKNVDRLKPSHVGGFRYEFIFNDFGEFTDLVTVSYVHTALTGTNVELFYNQLSELTISSNEHIIGYTLLNLNGNCLKSESLNVPVKQKIISLPLAQAGIYFISIQLQNGTMVTKRFLKY
ncbi:MAG: redoxin domain-containing protein [Saprospiraceae bacterium]